MRLFHKHGAYDAFQRVMTEGLNRYPHDPADPASYRAPGDLHQHRFARRVVILRAS